MQLISYVDHQFSRVNSIGVIFVKTKRRKQQRIIQPRINQIALQELVDSICDKYLDTHVAGDTFPACSA